MNILARKMLFDFYALLLVYHCRSRAKDAFGDVTIIYVCQIRTFSEMYRGRQSNGAWYDIFHLFHISLENAAKGHTLNTLIIKWFC